MSDIKFDGDYVYIEGGVAKFTTFDVWIDAPQRRKVAGGLRRALVHDFNDGLTLNWDSDYPGGVTIRGALKLDLIEQFSLVLKCADIHVDHPQRRKTPAGVRRAFVHGPDDGLVLNWGGDYPGGVTINGEVKVPGKLLAAGKDVAATITSLEQKIAALEARIAKLEPKP